MKDWMQAVEYHHSFVKSLADEHGDYQVIFTALIGSQNYGLESENSDVDTFSIVLPTYFDFISETNLISFETDALDGKCVVKDFRLMMNLLRKTSPNSVEVFASKYKAFEPEYKNIENAFFNEDMLFHLTHANYRNMVNAICGLAHQVHGRNMTEGKRYSHILRMAEMYEQFMNNPRADQILSFRFGGARDMARVAKFGQTSDYDEYYKSDGERICNELKEHADTFEETNEIRSTQYTANWTINRLQFELTKKYLELNGFIYVE